MFRLKAKVFGADDCMKALHDYELHASSPLDREELNIEDSTDCPITRGGISFTNSALPVDLSHQ